MESRKILILVAAIAALACAAPAWPATTIEREYRFGPDDISIVRGADATEVRLRGGMREFAPGRPDLPWKAERVDLPAGQRVSGIEVIALETSPLADAVRVPSAIEPTPGLGPVQRTPPDPAVYGVDRFEPEAPVRLGPQGFERGTAVAWLQVSPTRWNPVSGRLERVSRVRVRLALEPSDATPLRRERVVPDRGRDGLPVSPGSSAPGRSSASAPGRPQAAPFKPTQIPSLLGSPVEYLIITNDAMAATFQQLADWKTQSGLPAVVRTTSFIRQEYPFGADDAERIRLFIRDAYARWGTQWVLLGGDTQIIPTRQGYTTFYGSEYIATDLYYSCLDGNWDADADSIYGEGYFSVSMPGDDVDLLPEVWVGRAPPTTVQEAQRFVDKTLMYERTPVPDYMTRMLFFAEVLFPQNWSPGMSTSLDGAELAEEVLPSVQTNPAMHYARLYENYTDPRWEPGALRETRAAVLDSLNYGYNIAVHIGHGYRNVMSVGDGALGNADAMGLTNGNRLINLYAINCTSNAIDFPCIGEAFIHAPNGGAVTNVGSTRFDFPTAGRAYQDEYFRLLYEDSVTAVGELQARQKLPFIAFSTYDGVNRWTQMTLLLLGDPELRLFIGTPRTLAVGAPASIVASDTGFAVNVMVGGQPLLGARVTAYKPGADYFSTLTDGAGNAWISFRPDAPGSLTLTVTGFDCVPSQATVPITASGQPVLANQACVVDDDNVGGTVGNGDGLFDAGETVDLIIPLKNNGGSTATNVQGTLSTTDFLTTITVPNASYGDVAASATVNPVAGFRVTVPFNAPDQHEIPFALHLTDGGGGVYDRDLQLVLRAPELRDNGYIVQDLAGNSDGKPDPGETVTYTIKLRNLGTGIARGVVAKLRNHDGLAAVTDSMSIFNDILAGEEKTADGVTFSPGSYAAKLELELSDQYGVLGSRLIDIQAPAPPTDLMGQGATNDVKLTWAKSSVPDLFGYNVYSSTLPSGPFVQRNPVPTDRIAYYLADGLAPLTLYYFRVTAVDSSSNESSPSAVISTSTNPPAHAIFPIPMDGNTPGSVAVDHVYSGYPMAIAAGATKLFVWHPDGTFPVDADGQGTTSGDFSILGDYYAAGPSIGDLDGDGIAEIVGTTWTSKSAYAFDRLGNLLPGWPLLAADNIWSSAVIGDLDGDGQQEIAFGSNSNMFYVMRGNGTEWMDGDSNPATVGVFKVIGAGANYGTPAIVDLDNDGQKEIIYAGADAKLYAWHPNGTNVTGFPVQLNAPVTASVAVGYLDGAGDPMLEIVVPTVGDSVYVFEANAARRTGWPKGVKTGGSSKTPSPALADMNADDSLDVVLAGTNGGVYVYDRNGAIIAPFNNVRYSTYTSGASESSPVVADINGDGRPDIVVGSEDVTLTAISGISGTILPGFPIALDGEVRSTPALADIDGDGLSEIVLAGWDKNLYVWDYDFPFSPGATPPWPQFHHDARRTGFASSPAFVAVDGAPPAPARVELAPPYPNPARVSAGLRYSIPADHAGAPYELAIYDLSGRRVQRVERGIARSGRFSAQWNLRDESGTPVRNGIYFLRFAIGGKVFSTAKFVVMR